MSIPLPPALADAIPGLPQALWEELVEHYSADGRHYHDVAHLRALDRHFADVAAGPGWRHPQAVALAILFHDVIYVSGRKDNEERSAAMARESIARHLPEAAVDVERVVELIEWTARHGKIDSSEVCEDPDAAHFLDADMAILGTDAEGYRLYEEQVRQEYKSLPGPVFALGRRRFLNRLWKSDRIFLSEYFFARYEQPARDNIRAALRN